MPRSKSAKKKSINLYSEQRVAEERFSKMPVVTAMKKAATVVTLQRMSSRIVQPVVEMAKNVADVAQQAAVVSVNQTGNAVASAGARAVSIVSGAQQFSTWLWLLGASQFILAVTARSDTSPFINSTLPEQNFTNGGNVSTSSEIESSSGVAGVAVPAVVGAVVGAGALLGTAYFVANKLKKTHPVSAARELVPMRDVNRELPEGSALSEEQIIQFRLANIYDRLGKLSSSIESVAVLKQRKQKMIDPKQEMIDSLKSMQEAVRNVSKDSMHNYETFKTLLENFLADDSRAENLYEIARKSETLIDSTNKWNVCRLKENIIELHIYLICLQTVWSEICQPDCWNNDSLFEGEDETEGATDADSALSKKALFFLQVNMLMLEPVSLCFEQEAQKNQFFSAFRALETVVCNKRLNDKAGLTTQEATTYCSNFLKFVVQHIKTIQSCVEEIPNVKLKISYMCVLRRMQEKCFQCMPAPLRTQALSTQETSLQRWGMVISDVAVSSPSLLFASAQDVEKPLLPAAVSSPLFFAASQGGEAQSLSSTSSLKDCRVHFA